jgi:phage-related protein
MKWEIELYEDIRGNIPVDQFYRSLTSKAEKAKMVWVIDLLQELGIELGMPYARPVKSSVLWELRPMSNRILYFLFTRDNRFVLLHAFRKKTRETPEKHIETALKRMRDYIERNDE